MIYRALSSHSKSVKALITMMAVRACVTPQSYFENNVPDHLKNDSDNVLNFLSKSSSPPVTQGMEMPSIALEPHELYLKNLQHQPQQVITYIRNRAANYPGFSAQNLFDKVPDHLKDNPEEILDFLSKKYGDSIGMEVSHINSQVNHPHLAGDANNILLETTAGNPNQVRQGFDMSRGEAEQVFADAKQRALTIEYQNTGDDHFFNQTTPHHFTTNAHDTVDLALSHNYDGLADSIHFGLESLATTLGVSLSYAVVKTYSPRIIAVLRYLVSHHQTLINDASSREKFVRCYVMPLVKAEDADQLGVSFIVGLILACIPGIRELLLVYGLVSLCKLALPHVERFVNYVAQCYPRLAKLLHWVVGGIGRLINALHQTLSTLWQTVEKVASVAWQTAKQGAKVVGKAAVKTATVAKDCLVRFFNWSWGKVKGLFSRPQTQLNPV